MLHMFRHAIRGIDAVVSLVAAVILIPVGSFVGEATAAEVVVSWTEVQEEIRPRQATHRVAKRITLTLQGGNVITDSSVSTSARGQSTSKGREGRLGASIESKRGSVSWSVQSSKSLVRTQSRPQHVDVIRVTTHFDTSCAATVSFRLKPGFREYRLRRISDGESMYFRSLSAENVS